MTERSKTRRGGARNTDSASEDRPSLRGLERRTRVSRRGALKAVAAGALAVVMRRSKAEPERVPAAVRERIGDRTVRWSRVVLDAPALAASHAAHRPVQQPLSVNGNTAADRGSFGVEALKDSGTCRPRGGIKVKQRKHACDVAAAYPCFGQEPQADGTLPCAEVLGRATYALGV